MYLNSVSVLTVELNTLRTLERAFEWSNEGLLFTLEYSNAYFDRFDDDLLEDTGLQPPGEVVDRSDIDRSGSIDVDDVASISQQTAAGSQHVASAAEEQTATLTEVSESATELSTGANGLQSALAEFDVDHSPDDTDGNEPLPVDASPIEGR